MTADRHKPPSPYETPRDRVGDLEADGIQRPDSIKPLTPEGGVYEFELQRRNFGEGDLDSFLESNLLPTALYDLGFPKKKLSEKMLRDLLAWLIRFREIGKKYGDYSWLDDRKIRDLMLGTARLLDIEVRREGADSTNLIERIIPSEKRLGSGSDKNEDAGNIVALSRKEYARQDPELVARIRDSLSEEEIKARRDFFSRPDLPAFRDLQMSSAEERDEFIIQDLVLDKIATQGKLKR